VSAGLKSPLLTTRPAFSNLRPVVPCNQMTPFRGEGLNGQRVAIRTATTATTQRAFVLFRSSRAANCSFTGGTCASVPAIWSAGSPYAAFFTGVDSSFPGKAWARSSEAMQIKKHTTLTSNRFRFVRLTSKNSLVAMLRCNKPPHTNAIQPT